MGSLRRKRCIHTLLDLPPSGPQRPIYVLNLNLVSLYSRRSRPFWAITNDSKKTYTSSPRNAELFVVPIEPGTPCTFPVLSSLEHYFSGLFIYTKHRIFFSTILLIQNLFKKTHKQVPNKDLIIKKRRIN